MDTLRFGATIIDTVVKKGKKSTGGWASRMLIEQIIIVCVLYSTKRYNIYNQVYTIQGRRQEFEEGGAELFVPESTWRGAPKIPVTGSHTP